jgi:tetratricopeptide (TPR) repeat protein
VQTRAFTLPIAALLLAGAAGAQGTSITTGGSSERPISISGIVAVADGSPLPEKAAIELVCSAGRVQQEGKTDAKGGFNVQLGLNSFEGASDASAPSLRVSGPITANRPTTPSGTSTAVQVDGASVMSLEGCFVRAALRGYTSDSYDLSRIHLGDVNTNVGTVFVHPIGKTPQGAVSATSLAAPKDAQKSLDKARGLISNRQYADAEKELNHAVQVYPKYAEAWQELGSVLQSEKKNDDARKAYLEAVSSDAKYPRPYLSLARLSAVEQNWQDAIDKSAALLQLDPTGYPLAWYYNAVGQFNLHNYDKALESAQQAVKLDPNHEVALAEQLLAVIDAEKGDYKSAAEQYRNYLQHVAPGTDVDAVKARLAGVEARAAAQTPQK